MTIQRLYFSYVVCGFWEKQSTILKMVHIRNQNGTSVYVYVVTIITTYATIMIGIRAISYLIRHIPCFIASHGTIACCSDPSHCTDVEALLLLLLLFIWHHTLGAPQRKGEGGNSLWIQSYLSFPSLTQLLFLALYFSRVIVCIRIASTIVLLYLTFDKQLREIAGYDCEGQTAGLNTIVRDRQLD